MLEKLKQLYADYKTNKKPGPSVFSIICFIIFSVALVFATIKYIASGEANFYGILLFVGGTGLIVFLTIMSIIKFIKIRKKENDSDDQS